MSAVTLSVIVAAHGRPDGIVRLIEDLADQELAASFEVIVVDDDSPQPVIEALRGVRSPASVRVIRIPHGGAAVARDVGTQHASGEIIVFVDDDMRLPPSFLAAHLAEHRVGPNPLVVFGNIESADALATMPLFERYHARQLDRFRAAVRAGTTQPRGVHLCTGNVSITAEAYQRCGGFDLTLPRSEDRDLGVRLQKIGATFRLSEAAISVHASDHASLERWLRRATQYGECDTKIAFRHPGVADAHPWRFWPLMPRLARPLLATVMALPALGPISARVAYAIAVMLDRMGLPSKAVSLTALSFAIEYFRGIRIECGSLRDVRRFVTTATDTPATSTSEPDGSRRTPTVGLLASIRADHDATRRQRRKYHGEELSRVRIVGDVFTKIGFQMLVWMRIMWWLHAHRIPLLPAICSRLIRHLYGAEIHWRARIAPGISIVHGTGLVISHAAVVEAGCILFQGVTLGESVDPVTGEIGAPRLGRDVHVGPGATLLGPIDIGEGSKIMAGVVLTMSVPPRSLAAAPAPVVTTRRNRTSSDNPVAAMRNGHDHRRQHVSHTRNPRQSLALAREMHGGS